jgi:hypothetical protein
MNFILEPAVPAGRRVLMAHRMIRLDDGHNVGISLAGGGVPLVFFRGMALSRRVYARMLSHLPQLGFLTVALSFDSVTRLPCPNAFTNTRWPMGSSADSSSFTI